VLGCTFLVAGLAQGLQVSAAVGAFLVGIALSGPAAHGARPLLAPLRDLFAAVFFVFFGLQTDPTQIPAVALPAAALGLVTILTKLATGWWAARSIGIGVPGRLRMGTILVARGEFSIVIAGLAAAAALPETTLRPLAAAYVMLLAVLGPILTRLADRLADLVQRPGRRRRQRAASSVSEPLPESCSAPEPARPRVPLQPRNDNNEAPAG
jgi:CPA2 family monovalent cation:H+ antiporter-2